MAGFIKDYIEQLIKKQLDEHGVVVWYDPDGNYREMLQDVNLDAPIVEYDGSYYDLRFKTEPYFEGIDQHKLLVYLKAKRDMESFPLIELEKAGSIIESAGPIERNTNLAVVVREALSGKISQELISDVCKKVEEKTITIDEIEKISENAKSINTASLSIIFNTNEPQSIILQFLTSIDLDKTIKNKKIEKELQKLINFYFGIEIGDSLSLQQLRDKVIEIALMVDFIHSLKDGARKDRYKTLKLPDQESYIASVKSLVDLWRKRSDVNEAFVKKSEEVQQIYHIPSETFLYKEISDVHTFPVIDGMLINACLTDIDSMTAEEVQEIARARKNAFWANKKGEYSLIWTIIECGCNLQRLIADALINIKQKELSPSDLINLYVARDHSGWFVIDKHYRSLEAKYAEFDIGNNFDDELEKFVARIRDLYSKLLNAQSDAITLKIKNIDIPLILKQKDVFRNSVSPILESKKKCAYFLVDAFRYEMGEELYDSIENSEKKDILPVLASVPTITPFGMLTLLLLSGDQISINFLKGKLSLEVNGAKADTRNERLKYFEEKCPSSLDVFELEEVINPKKSVRERIKKAELIIITSQEIDSLCESGKGLLAKQVMNQIILNLKRAVYHLSELGIEDFVISADHGFLLGNEVGKELKIDAPDGETYGLHKRVWIGKGGNNPENTVRMKASDLGYTGDFDFVIPKGLSVFKTPGSENDYFHGGLSFQEMVIPMISIQMKPSLKQKKAHKEEYALNLSKDSITNRIFTLTLQYKVEEMMFAEMLADKKKVRIGILKDQTQIGRAVASEYGLDEATNEIILERNRKNVVTIILNENIAEGNISIVLIDSRTELELARMADIPLKIIF